jgi:phosphoadenylyl-sulfate reductase (thioredoxin)
MVLIDLAARRRERTGKMARVFFADTLRLFPETYAFLEEVERHYGFRIERLVPDPLRLARMIAQHGEDLFFHTKAKQEYCCKIRKVEPVERLLGTLACWISGTRRDQSPARAATPKAEWIEWEGRRILKVSPLADWTEKETRDYLQAHGVPIHPLLDRGYPSLGCVVCTTPTLPGEAKRAGRWRWWNARAGEDAKECGIHLISTPGERSDSSPLPH